MAAARDTENGLSLNILVAASRVEACRRDSCFGLLET